MHGAEIGRGRECPRGGKIARFGGVSIRVFPDISDREPLSKIAQAGAGEADGSLGQANADSTSVRLHR